MIKKISELLWNIFVFIFEVILLPLPFFQKAWWKVWYNWLSKDKTREKDFLFMNYGHHETDEIKEKERKKSYLKKRHHFLQLTIPPWPGFIFTFAKNFHLV